MLDQYPLRTEGEREFFSNLNVIVRENNSRGLELKEPEISDTQFLAESFLKIAPYIYENKELIDTLLNISTASPFRETRENLGSQFGQYGADMLLYLFGHRWDEDGDLIEPMYDPEESGDLSEIALCLLESDFFNRSIEDGDVLSLTPDSGYQIPPTYSRALNIAIV